MTEGIVTKSLSAGLAAYHKQAIEILGWMPDWLHQNDFDLQARRLALDWAVICVSRETYILGEFGGGQKALHLLQFLCMEGFAEQRKSERGGYEYRAKAIPA